MKHFVLAGLLFLITALTLSYSPNRWLDSSAKTSTNWAGWRGPDGQGISLEKNLPSEWSDTKNVLWKTPIAGRGYSQPVIWGNRVFLTTDVENGAAPATHKPPVHMMGKEEFKHPEWAGVNLLHKFETICLDRDSGKVLWEKVSYEGTVFDYRHKRGNYAAPTPVTDGKYVWSYFGSEGLYCYDFKGNLVWKKSLGQILTLGMGVATSPVLFDNVLIIQCDENEGEKSFIVGFDKKTGKEVWRQARKVQVSWSTPVLVNAGTRTELITSGNELVIAYDPKTGKELWQTEGVKANAIATPLIGHGLVIASTGYPSKNIIAIKPGGTGKLGADQVVWKYNKGTAYVPSPILYGDYVYLMSDGGVMTCLEAKTGKIVYEGGRVPIATKFYGASPVAFDDKILLTSDDGDTFVIKAGPKHEVLGTNSLGEPCKTSIAIADGKLFIRGEKHLFCIGKPTKGV